MDGRQAVMALLRAVPHLKALDESCLRDLVASAELSLHQAGSLIFSEGEETSGLFIVETGKVKISRFTREGREHILRFLGAGELFNTVGVLDGGPNPATAIAFTDARLWRIRRPELQRVMVRHPALAWAFIENLAGHTRYLVGVVEDLAMRNVKGRLAHLLLEQAQVNQADSIARYMTQEEMASHLGTVREMVGRALHSLAAAEIISIDRHRILILDRERLAKEAEV